MPDSRDIEVGTKCDLQRVTSVWMYLDDDLDMTPSYRIIWTNLKLNVCDRKGRSIQLDIICHPPKKEE